MLIVFTGNGKGKTTAALGQALRSVGDGKKVLVVQFIKGPWKSGEDTSYKNLSPNLHIEKTGLGFVGIGGDNLPKIDHSKAAYQGLAYIRHEVDNGLWDIVILDEIWNALALDLVHEDDIAAFITYAIPRLEQIIMTGRDCPPRFIEMADLVTEMKEIKHPFAKGIPGKKGLEF